MFSFILRYLKANSLRPNVIMLLPTLRQLLTNTLFHQCSFKFSSASCWSSMSRNKIFLHRFRKCSPDNRQTVRCKSLLFQSVRQRMFKTFVFRNVCSDVHTHLVTCYSKINHCLISLS